MTTLLGLEHGGLPRLYSCSTVAMRTMGTLHGLWPISIETEA